MKQLNSFIKGIVDDLAFNHVKQDNWVFPSHNIRITNKRGQGYIVTTQLGNEEFFSVVDGYTVIAAQEHRGIIYLISVKEVSGEYVTQIGCYPYPKAWDYPIPDPAITGFIQEYGVLKNYLTTLDYTMTTTKFGYTAESNLKMIIDDAFDESVNLYLCDGVNTDKIVNSGFMPDGKLNSFVYHESDFYGKINHILYSLKPVIIDTVSVPVGGKLPPGQYHVFFAYKTASYDKTDYFSESFPISVAEGNSITSVHGETDLKSNGDKNYTRKKIVLELSGLDTDYKYLSVALMRFFSDGDGNIQHDQFEIATDNIIDGTKLSIEITGHENKTILTSEELYNLSLKERISKDHCFYNSRIFKANLKSTEYDKTIFENLALLVTAVTDKTTSMTISGYDDIVHNSVTTKLDYQDPEYIYSTLGYFENEVYPFAATFFLKDGITTDAYPITGRNEDVLFPIVTNDKGLFKFKRDNVRLAVIGVKFFIGALLTEIDTNPDYSDIIGFNIVRGERIKNMLYDGALERTANGVSLSKNRKTSKKTGSTVGSNCWYYNREPLWFASEDEENSYHMPVFRYGHNLKNIFYPRSLGPTSFNYYTFPHATFNDNGNERSTLQKPIFEFVDDIFNVTKKAPESYEYSIAVENPTLIADSNDTKHTNGDNDIKDKLIYTDALDTKLEISETHFSLISPDFMTEIDHLTEDGQEYYMKVYDSYSGTQYSEGSLEYESLREDGSDFLGDPIRPSRTRVFEFNPYPAMFLTTVIELIELRFGSAASVIITDSSGDVWVYCTHDKDVTDLTSVWDDSSGNKWVLDEIDTYRLRLSQSAHTSDIPGAPAILTHSSGATHTSDIDYTKVLSVAEWTDNCLGLPIPIPSINAYIANGEYIGAVEDIGGDFVSSISSTQFDTSIVSLSGTNYGCIKSTLHGEIYGYDTAPHPNYYKFNASVVGGVSVSDTYTNNGNTYVVQSIGNQFVVCSSSGGAPTASGNLVRTTGTGTNPIVFSSYSVGGEYWIEIANIGAFKQENSNNEFSNSIPSTVTTGLFVKPSCFIASYPVISASVTPFIQTVKVYNVEKGTYKGTGKFSSYAEDGKEYHITGKKGLYSLTGYMANEQTNSAGIWLGGIAMNADQKSALIHYNRSYQTPSYLGIIPVIPLGDPTFGSRYNKNTVYMVKLYKENPDTEDFFNTTLSSFDPKYEQYWNISNLIKVTSSETHSIEFKGDNFKTISWFRMSHHVDYDDNQSKGHPSRGFMSWFVNDDLKDIHWQERTTLRSSYFLDKSYNHGILYGLVTSNRNNINLRSLIKITNNENEEVEYSFFPNVANSRDPLGWIYSSSDKSDVVESLNINDGYNDVSGFIKKIGVDTNTPYDSKSRKTAIAFSSRRVVNSYADGYRSMNATDVVDFETNYGEIMRIEELYGMLVTMRTRATMKHFVGQKKITEDLQYDTSSIYLSDETSPLLYYGIQDWHALIKTRNAIYAVDVDNSMIFRITMETTSMDANKLKPSLMSKAFMIEKKTKELIDLLATVRTTPMKSNGISIGYNEEYSEIYFTFINGIKKETLVFSEDKNFFTGTSSLTASIYAEYNKGVITSLEEDSFGSGVIYLSNSDSTSISFYGAERDSILSFIVNGNTEEENSVILTKIFESLAIGSPHKSLNRILYETELQKGEYTFTEDSTEFWKDARWIEGSWLVPIIRENVADREDYYEEDSNLRGRWLKITLEFDNDMDFSITEIITEFKQSFS